MVRNRVLESATERPVVHRQPPALGGRRAWWSYDTAAQGDLGRSSNRPESSVVRLRAHSSNDDGSLVPRPLSLAQQSNDRRARKFRGRRLGADRRSVSFNDQCFGWCFYEAAGKSPWPTEILAGRLVARNAINRQHEARPPQTPAGENRSGTVRGCKMADRTRRQMTG